MFSFVCLIVAIKYILERVCVLAVWLFKTFFPLNYTFMLSALNKRNLFAFPGADLAEQIVTGLLHSLIHNSESNVFFFFPDVVWWLE